MANKPIGPEFDRGGGEHTKSHAHPGTKKWIVEGERSRSAGHESAQRDRRTTSATDRDAARRQAADFGTTAAIATDQRLDLDQLATPRRRVER